jgi:hypothetical protein
MIELLFFQSYSQYNLQDRLFVSSLQNSLQIVKCKKCAFIRSLLEWFILLLAMLVISTIYLFLFSIHNVVK